jgi:hypothetical protein
VATALPLRSLLRPYDGELHAALDDLREAERLAGAFGVLSLSDEVFIALRRFDLLVRLGRTAQATELITATRDRALRSVSPELAVLLDARESRPHVQTGDLERAGRLIEAAQTGLRAWGPQAGEHGRALPRAPRSGGPGCTARRPLLTSAPALAVVRRVRPAGAAARRVRPVW